MFTPEPTGGGIWSANRGAITLREAQMSTTIRTPRRRPPTPPGEMLAEEFLKPLRMTQKDLAKRIHRLIAPWE